jgi:DNA polymerase III subunit epsilon
MVVASRHNYWANKSFVAFDTETTGLDFENDRMIQGALAVFLKGQNVWNWDWLINTRKESSPEALGVHGISDELRYTTGTDAKSVCLHLRALFCRMRDRNSPLVAFNAPFDFSMVRAEFKRFKINMDWKGLHVIDPLTIDRHYQKNVPVFTAPFMRQVEMAARYGVSAPTHNALDDAICTGHIALAQTLHHSAIRTASPIEMDRRQAQWHQEWAAKVTAFTNKKGLEWSIPAWPFGDGLENDNQRQDALGTTDPA